MKYKLIYNRKIIEFEIISDALICKQCNIVFMNRELYEHLNTCKQNEKN